jgi:hypothetical protein
MYQANKVSTLENIEFMTTNSPKMRKMDQNALGTGGLYIEPLRLKELAVLTTK